MSPENVLIVAKGFPPDDGGIETYSYNVAKAFEELGHCVHVVTSVRRPSGAPRNQFHWFKAVRQRAQILTAFSMMRVCIALKRSGYCPDLIHATSWRVAAISQFLWLRTPIVVTVHGKEVFGLSSLIRRLAEFVLARAQTIVFVSDAIRQRFLSEFPSFTEANTIVSWNGCTDFGDVSDLPAKEPNAIFTVCRLVERKNLHLALEAVSLIDHDKYPFKYRLAGTGPLAASLKAKAHALGLDDRFEMLGFVPDDEIAREYSRASIFLHPQIEADGGTDIEGFGIVLADAMRFGAVPIAGDNGGPRDFIHHGENGYLVEGDSAEELADILTRALTDLNKSGELRSATKEFAQSFFTWERHVNKIKTASGLWIREM
ncbi:glycosyltransferase family 4 protein [Qipengyuania sp. XHP0207]|uniref:glycosyltransferase family 4 protein n=1 Tax=Qipengyuania sp. XHP0207 TaxID=3038078 RepID=UPI00241F9ADE|nr:glycosyltransferase family 4 protein [Qipengyuania sp. XHP0207]MDG5747278.1 glycosyltransferase family 4 protein [Qipengyuania sp. XHP0207]